jgi:hypothetical protein
MEDLTAQSKVKRSPLPSLGDMLFLIIFLFPLLLLPNYMFGDGSVGWHLATGDYILQHHAIPSQDFISYTFANKPWVAFYWLFDLLMSAANAIGGINGVAIFCAAIIASVFLLVYQRMRADGCDQLLASFFILIGAVASTVHWIARPLLASFLGVYVFSTVMEDFHRRKISVTRLMLTLSITSLLWINMHPAYVMGLAILVIYMVTALIAAFAAPDAEARKQPLFEAKWLLITAVVITLVTLINPWGINLYGNLLAYLGQSKLTDSVDEYKSPVFHGIVFASALELIFFILCFGLFLRRKNLSVPQLLTTLAFAHLSLQSVRNIPVFVITALPLIGFLYGELPGSLLAGREGNGFVTNFLKKWSDSKSGIDNIEKQCSMHLLPVLAVLIFGVASANGGKLFGNELVACNWDAGHLPVQTLQYITDHKLPPDHGFNHVNWGGLINWRTKIPVFIDDRASFYGEDFYYQYGLAVSLAPGWQQYLDDHHINWIIYPKDAGFTRALLESGRWKILSEDKIAYILERK